MAGRIIKDNAADISVADTNGYVTVTSTTGFYEKARCYLSKASAAGKECEITEIKSSTQMGLRFVRGLGQGPNYGRDDVSGFGPETRLNYTGAAGTGTVTGGTSGATATVVSSTPTYLVISGVTGTFQNGEVLTYTSGGPGAASGSQYSVTGRIDMPAQFIFNPNDKPLD